MPNNMHDGDEPSAPLASRADVSDGEPTLSPPPRGNQEKRRPYHRIPKRVFWGVILPFLCFVLGTAPAFFIWAHLDRDLLCAYHTSMYSPVLEDTRVSYETRQFNGSFMRENIFRQLASPAVDAAWASLGVNYRPGVITTDQGLRSGLSDSHVQRAEKYGGGYLVNAEGMHHLHCLDLLRKGLYYNVEYYKTEGKTAFKNDEAILRLHMSHCLDTLRQVLMCNVDTGVLGQVWVAGRGAPGMPVAFPDFDTEHKCKNFEAIREWAESIQAIPNEEAPSGYLKKPNLDDILPFTP